MKPTRIIRFSKTQIWLTEADCLPLGLTSLPAHQVAALSALDKAVYLEVEPSYDKDAQTFGFRVVQKLPTAMREQYFHATKKLTRPVRKVTFEPVATAVLLGQAEAPPVGAGFTTPIAPGTATAPSADSAPLPVRLEPRTIYIPPGPSQIPLAYSPPHQPAPPWPTAWTATFNYHFTDAEFANGELRGVWNKPPKGHRPVPFHVENPYLQAEFKYICGYFTRKLKSKTFDVALSVREHPDGTRDVTATSQLVAQIDALLVEKWRTARAAEARKQAAKITIDSPAPTLDDLAKQLRNPDEPAALLTPGQLQSLWIELAEGRHRQQLEYLANDKHDLTLPVRLTVGKYVGFVFSITGLEERHFCWELLDTNATYLWSFPLTLADTDALAVLEAQLRTLNQMGRQEYRKKRGEMGESGRFRWLEHALQGLTPEQTFQRWRGELINYLS